MTREYREYAKSRIEYLLKISRLDERDKEALEAAIQALSQEPTDENLHREREQAYMQGYEDASKRFRQEPCDDVVSRQAVLKLKHHKPEYGDMIYAFDVEQLPSVTQKSKTGHWIKKEDDTCWWYACSECEQEPLKNRWNDDDVLSAFCPNCGCRMVEPQERSDKE